MAVTGMMHILLDIPDRDSGIGSLSSPPTVSTVKVKLPSGTDSSYSVIFEVLFETVFG